MPKVLIAGGPVQPGTCLRCMRPCTEEAVYCFTCEELVVSCRAYCYCYACGSPVAAADPYCRWCGVPLRAVPPPREVA